MISQTRRAVLASIAGMSTFAMLGGCAGTMSASSMAAPRKLGIQLYMLGDDVGTDLDGTLRQLATIGYREVELPHLYNRDPAALAKAIKDAGLSCPSMHAPLEPMWPGMPTLQNVDVIAAAAKTLGVTYVVVPIFPAPARLARPMRENDSFGQMLSEAARQMTMAEWQDIARRLDDAGAALARHGLKLSYHNHNVEFIKVPDGRTALDLLMDETDPARVSLELDVGWVAAAGLDPAAMVDHYGSRIRQVHLKDLQATPPNIAIVMNPANVGQGIIDWKKLLPALDRAHVEHLYIEQEAPFAGSRMDAAKVAFDFLQSARFSGAV